MGPDFQELWKSNQISNFVLFVCFFLREKNPLIWEGVSDLGSDTLSKNNSSTPAFYRQGKSHLQCAGPAICDPTPANEAL